MNKLITLATTFILAVLLAAPATVGQEGDPVEPAIAIYSGGIDVLQQSSKDRALHEAMLLLQRNGLQLPREMLRELPPEGREVIDLLMDVFMSRMTFTLSFDDKIIREQVGNYMGVVAGVQLQVSVFGNSGMTPESLFEQVKSVIEKSNGPPMMPVKEHPGLHLLQAPLPVYLGVQEINGESAMVISLNAMPRSIKIDPGGFGIGDGTFGAGFVDFDRMSTILQATMTPPEMKQMWTQMGILGPETIRIEWNVSATDELGTMQFAIRNFKQHFGHLFSDEPVTREDLELVPEDANAMTVSKYRMSRLFDMFPSATTTPEGRAVDPTPMDMAMGMAKSALGIDLRTQFLDYMGDTVIGYRSDSTGGGGLMSTVMLVKLDNSQGMVDSVDTMRGHLNRMAANEADGHVHLVKWSDAECGDITTLAFPGLPIPIELSMAICGDTMVFGLSPQAVVAAARQKQESRSILSNGAFRGGKGPTGIGKSMGIDFYDVPSRLADGYAIMNAAMAAVSNFSRSVDDPSRGVGMILPTYMELSRDAIANVSQTSMDGDDLIYRTTGDPSFTVQMTGLMSEQISLFLPAAMSAGMVSGVMLPAMGNARKAAKRTRSMADVRNLINSLNLYAADHDGDMPDSLDVLVAQHYISNDQLFDLRNGQEWVYRNPGRIHDLKQPSSTPLIHESRASDGSMIVGFCDGHVRLVTDPSEFPSSSHLDTADITPPVESD
ncbi:MAG: hypothetical protein CMJ24_00300 [Phycisphaerae bacterium]|nr:hypothetical protein [Phycisphaerae bacterium]|tara:strand:- start:1053 stop:3212 length:2160 start_codon:yes stop_codon:yes gene_type:complete